MKKLLVKIKYMFIIFIKTFIKPFWFSKTSKEVVAPYVYTTVNMAFFYASVYVFLKLSWKTATIGIQHPAIVLPTLASIIGTLIILNHSMLTIYNRSKKTKVENNNEVTKINETPNTNEKGVMED